MSESTTPTDRDAKSGRFVSGNVGGPGRKPGSRNRLAESFIADLHTVWEKHGLTALEKCAIDEPGQFIRVLAMLMPKDVNLSVALDPADFASRFRSAREMLGNDEPPSLRRPLPNQPLAIEHDDGR